MNLRAETRAHGNRARVPSGGECKKRRREREKARGRERDVDGPSAEKERARCSSTCCSNKERLLCQRRDSDFSLGPLLGHLSRSPNT